MRGYIRRSWRRKSGGSTSGGAGGLGDRCHASAARHPGAGSEPERKSIGCESSAAVATP